MRNNVIDLKQRQLMKIKDIAFIGEKPVQKHDSDIQPILDMIFPKKALPKLQAYNPDF